MNSAKNGGVVENNFGWGNPHELTEDGTGKVTEGNGGRHWNNPDNSSAWFSAIFRILSERSGVLYFFSNRNACSKTASTSSVSVVLFRFFVDDTSSSSCFLCSCCPFWMMANSSIKFAGTSGTVAVLAVKTAGAVTLVIGTGGTVIAVVGGVVARGVVMCGKGDCGQVARHGSFAFLGVGDFLPEVRLGLETTRIGLEKASGEIKFAT